MPEYIRRKFVIELWVPNGKEPHRRYTKNSTSLDSLVTEIQTELVNRGMNPGEIPAAKGQIEIPVSGCTITVTDATELSEVTGKITLALDTMFGS